ncbi:hypothetical protein [Domibacillus enclensis]|uniref:Alpha-ribazole kinase n=1 Tax=Domibacillus enclensis TaxID=1017273 RepID=A0A1N6WTW6_9BACI|nr:hypothetical protein [Domibacillus enclensis]OXS78033.1 hypothetical protein B1B05_10555 [Domibacillus enclensis]SIQ93584.1 alpha-ribazole kinase [Domibacillus enclensis]
MRNAIVTNGLVLAVDNSGSVGEKKQDDVAASYETVGYFSARVAIMECMAAGGEPFAAVVHNFSGDAAWPALYAGTEKAAFEAGYELEITGSSESNFHLNQSASGILMIGRHVRKTDQIEQRDMQYGVIGKPLVGGEVLAHSHEIAPLSLFRQLIGHEGVAAVWPVGSKGIAHELQQFTGRKGSCELDMNKSGGPSTCFLIAATRQATQKIKSVTPLIRWIKMEE